MAAGRRIALAGPVLCMMGVGYLSWELWRLTGSQEVAARVVVRDATTPEVAATHRFVPRNTSTTAWKEAAEGRPVEKHRLPPAGEFPASNGTFLMEVEQERPLPGEIAPAVAAGTDEQVPAPIISTTTSYEEVESPSSADNPIISSEYHQNEDETLPIEEESGRIYPGGIAPAPAAATTPPMPPPDMAAVALNGDANTHLVPEGHLSHSEDHYVEDEALLPEEEGLRLGEIATAVGISVEMATTALNQEAESHSSLKDHLHPSENFPVEDEKVIVDGDQDRLHPDRFWKAYAADRYSLLTRGVVYEEINESIRGESPPSASDNSRVRPTKYLVFQRPVAGLGNHMSGMMSTFALSIAIERVFMHDWIEPIDWNAARYDEIFVPPFEPWDISADTGSRVSGPDGLLAAAEHADSGGSVGVSFRKVSATSARETWIRPPEMSSRTERERCFMDLQPAGGVNEGHFNSLFIENRGQDPRPDCPVLYITSNQFLVEVVSSPAYGNSKVGGILLSEWLQPGKITETLFAGLFRPVDVVRQRVADESARIYPTDGQTIAAHARSFYLDSLAKKTRFVGCLGQLARSRNVSTILLATDMSMFQEEKSQKMVAWIGWSPEREMVEYPDMCMHRKKQILTSDPLPDQFAASKLKPSSTRVITMAGVQRAGEGPQTRNTLEKIQLALTEMLLVGKADIVVASPRSSFSELAAASRGDSTQRFGGLSCERQVNDPEFHSLECAKDEWKVVQIQNPEEWNEIYPFVASNSKRCKG